MHGLRVLVNFSHRNLAFSLVCHRGGVLELTERKRLKVRCTGRIVLIDALEMEVTRALIGRVHALV